MLDHRQAYLEMVEKHIRYLHHKRFHRLWNSPTREGEWCGRFQITQNLAFQFAVLYDFTGSERYLENAKKYLLDFDQGYHFTSLFCARTYELLRNKLTVSERKDFAKRWVSDGRDALSQKVGCEDDIKPLRNVSNHALCACVYADYAQKLFPHESRHYHFKRITDRVWDVWWKRREFQEQASNYEGFSECFHCVWAELRGVKDEFYRTDSIRNIFERNERIVSPAGIVTAYGDSGHNEHATAWLALFEKVARETGNESLKQTAWKIFSCLKSLNLAKSAIVVDKALKKNIYNSRVLYAQHLHTMSWLAMAALWSDPKLKNKPRHNYAGVNTRLPYGYKLKTSDQKRLPTRKSPAHQVALTGGPDDPEKRTFLLLSTGPKLVHDHPDAGSILMLSRGHSCLLGSNGYLQRELLYHNTFYAQKSSWSQFPEDKHGQVIRGDDNCHGCIEDIQIRRNDSYCRISFQKYHNMPLTLCREIFIDSSGNVTLLDRATAQKKGLCGGLLFHAEHIRKISERIYRCRINMLRSMCGMELANAPDALLVDFIYPEGNIGISRLNLPEIYSSPVYQSFPCCHYTKVWQRSYTARKCLYIKRELQQGQEEVFITRLAPGA